MRPSKRLYRAAERVELEPADLDDCEEQEPRWRRSATPLIDGCTGAAAAVIGTFSLAANSIFARHFLGEVMTPLHWCGMLLIAVGATMVLVSTLGVKCSNSPEAMQEIAAALLREQGVKVTLLFGLIHHREDQDNRAAHTALLLRLLIRQSFQLQQLQLQYCRHYSLNKISLDRSQPVAVQAAVVEVEVQVEVEVEVEVFFCVMVCIDVTNDRSEPDIQLSVVGLWRQLKGLIEGPYKSTKLI